MEEKVWMVLKYHTYFPTKDGGLFQKPFYRAATWKHEGEEVISKDLTEAEAEALVKILQ